MRMLRSSILAFISTAFLAGADFNFTYDADAHRWDLSNGVIHAGFALGSDGTFQLKALDSLATGQSWLPAEGPPSSPIHVRFGATTYDANTHFSLVKQYIENPSPSLYRQVILLKDAAKSVSIRVELDLYEGEPVLRHRVFVTNALLRTVYARLADIMPYSFAADDQTTLRLWRVAQWAILPQPQDFQANQVTLNHSGAAVTLATGARGTYCGWMALRDQDSRGFFAGWEFDGQATATARHYATDGYLQLAATVNDLFHPVAPGATFQVPTGFLGAFQGDWDEAGFRTQKFVENVLPPPLPETLPYVRFDSYAYGEAVDEGILNRK